MTRTKYLIVADHVNGRRLDVAKSSSRTWAIISKAWLASHHLFDATELWRGIDSDGVVCGFAGDWTLRFITAP